MRFVVIGGTARWLGSAGEGPAPHDLDVLLPPTDEAIDGLLGALAFLGGRSRTRRPRKGDELVEFEPWQLMTDLGALDVFALHLPTEQHRTVQVDGAVLTIY